VAYDLRLAYQSAAGLTKQSTAGYGLESERQLTMA